METIIRDLALILFVAGVTTLIFKKLKQPLVLGYIVAGFLTGPHFAYFPTIANHENVELWAEIGVIFLMFALGLEFSFYKLKKVGSSAFIATGVAISGIMIVGYVAGNTLGWSHMDSLFLGGMLGMSSTAIIFKAFEELGLKQEKFANMVLGMVIIEDIAGIVLMVLLSTIATASANVSPWELCQDVLKLVICLVLWFVVGMYFVPSFFKRFKDLFNDEILLVVSLGLCLLMVEIAETAGFSSALGAFIMGSLIAEAPSAERIEEIVKPVKDLFTAVFFVSVGMLVNPVILWDYILPVIAVVLVTMVGKMFCCSLGVLLAGKDLNTAIRCGSCLCQIGEFSFIIASMGSDLHVTSDFLYPIIVAVSVITTFTTPFFIDYSDRFYALLLKILPHKIIDLINRNNSNEAVEDNEWISLLRDYAVNLLILSVLLIAIGFGAEKFALPYLKDGLQLPFANYLTAAATLFIMSPFLGMLLRNSNKKSFSSIYYKSYSYHFPIYALIAGRLLVVFMALYFIFHSLVGWYGLATFAAILLVGWYLAKSRWFVSQYLRYESRFLVNLNEKHVRSHSSADAANRGEWLNVQEYLGIYRLLVGSPYVGKTLKALDFRGNLQADIIRITTENEICFMPGGDESLQAGASFTLLGSEKSFVTFANAIKLKNLQVEVIAEPETLLDYMNDETIPEDLRLYSCAIPINSTNALVGVPIRLSGIKERYNCLVAGIERGVINIPRPEPDFVLEADDLVWVIGSPTDIQVLANELGLAGEEKDNIE